MKTTVQHTPGPWSVVESTDTSKYAKDWREIRPFVVTSSQYDTRKWGENETYCGVRITEANARLIAAAPELLAALKEMYETFKFHSKGHELNASNRARAAIARAEGSA